MPKKRKGKSHTPSSSGTAIRPSPAGLLSGLSKAQSLVERDRLVEARDLLESLDRRYPRQSDLLYDLLGVYYDLKDMRGYRSAAERLSRLVSDDPDLDMGLAGAYMSNLQLAKALRAFRRFVTRWPTHPRATDARRTIGELEEILREQLEGLGLFGEEGLETAEMNEETLSLMGEGDYAGALKIAERLLERTPDFPAALNNLSMLRWLEGRPEQAIEATRKVLAANPDNVHALSNIVRFLYASGRADEAEQWVGPLKATRAGGSDVWTKKAEGLSYAGDDEGVLAMMEGARRDPDEGVAPQNPFLYHLAGAAAMRLGREEEARRYWQEALKLSPGFELAQANLDDLKKPVGERHAPWPYTISYWLPSRIIDDLRATLHATGKVSNEVAERAFRRFLRKHPEVEALVPTLLDRGDPVGRDFALRVARLTGTPAMLEALRDFALSTRGPDSMRMEAANLAVDAGLLPGGVMRMWSHGEWSEVMLMNFEVTEESDGTIISDEANDLMQEALEMLRQSKGEEAERLLKQALELEPDTPATPSILNNLAAAYEVQGRRAESHAIVEELYAQHPDYIFARVGLARLRIREGKRGYQEAKELLDPLLGRKRFHHTEFAALCGAYVELYHAMGNKDSARSWLDLWEKTDPDNPMLLYWRLRLGKRGARARAKLI